METMQTSTVIYYYPFKHAKDIAMHAVQRKHFFKIFLVINSEANHLELLESFDEMFPLSDNRLWIIKMIV